MLKTSFKMNPQPDDTSCGPTCLHSVYNFFGDPITLKDVIKEVKALKTGGTLAVMLGIHALKRGYKAKMYSYNLRIFDPTWAKLSGPHLIEKLNQMLEHEARPKRKLAIESYREYLTLGGKIHFDELTSDLILEQLEEGFPVLTGLSSTYLYKTMRETNEPSEENDIDGEPQGHFVVIYGHLENGRQIMLADPWKKNPLAKSMYYKVSIQRLINSILLGVLTYDGNLLILKPGK